MQQQTRPATTDELFGLAVARERQRLGLSQRDFASQLAIEGMNVDASAISRIEKGTRSVRLVEAVAIAKTLGVGLSTLARTPTSPEGELRIARAKANAALRNLGQEVWGSLISLWEVTDILQRNPDLLAHLEGEPTTIADYLRGVAARLDAWPVSEEEVTFLSPDLLVEVEALMAKFVRLYLGRHLSSDEWNRLHEADYSDGFNERPA